LFLGVSSPVLPVVSQPHTARHVAQKWPHGMQVAGTTGPPTCPNGPVPATRCGRRMMIPPISPAWRGGDIGGTVRSRAICRKWTFGHSDVPAVQMCRYAYLGFPSRNAPHPIAVVRGRTVSLLSQGAMNICSGFGCFATRRTVPLSRRQAKCAFSRGLALPSTRLVVPGSGREGGLSRCGYGEPGLCGSGGANGFWIHCGGLVSASGGSPLAMPEGPKGQCPPRSAAGSGTGRAHRRNEQIRRWPGQAPAADFNAAVRSVRSHENPGNSRPK
jgi:hypothetical protein